MKSVQMRNLTLAACCLAMLLPMTAMGGNYKTKKVFPADVVSNELQMAIGVGYDFAAGLARGTCLVTKGKNGFKKSNDTNDGKNQSSTFRMYSDFSDIANSWNMSFMSQVKVAIPLPIPGLKVKVSSKKGFHHTSSNVVSSFSQTIAASVSKIHKSTKIKGKGQGGQVKLQQKYVDYLEKGKFIKFMKECGNSFVWGVQKISEFQAYATIRQDSTTTSTTTGGVVGGGAEMPGVGGGEVTLKSAKAYDSTYGSKSIDGGITASGDYKKATSAKQIREAYRNWKPNRKKARTYVYYVASYEDYVSNWPTKQKGVFSGKSYGQLAQLVKKFWQLNSLIIDAKTIVKPVNRERFGLSKKAKDPAVEKLKGLTTTWLAKRKVLQTRMKNCLKNAKSLARKEAKERAKAAEEGKKTKKSNQVAKACTLGNWKNYKISKLRKKLPKFIGGGCANTQPTNNGGDFKEVVDFDLNHKKGNKTLGGQFFLYGKVKFTRKGDLLIGTLFADVQGTGLLEGTVYNNKGNEKELFRIDLKAQGLHRCYFKGGKKTYFTTKKVNTKKAISSIEITNYRHIKLLRCVTAKDALKAGNGKMKCKATITTPMMRHSK
jgi:hypothetical protein